MKRHQQICKIQEEESQFSIENDRLIDDVGFKQLLKTKQKFLQFVANPAVNSPLTFGPSNTSKEGVFDSLLITQLIDKRVEKMLKNQRLKKNWCKDDCTILAWLLEKLTNGRHLKCPEKLREFYWEQVASLISGTTADQCKFKWLSMKTSRLGNNKWSEQESNILQKIVKQIGTDSWKKISRLLYERNNLDDKKYRSPKQCREQWNCYLNPNLKKGSWSIQQDIQMISLVLRYGKRWSSFKNEEMSSRTENAIKNRYKFLLVRTKQNNNTVSNEEQLMRICLNQLKQNQQNNLKNEIKYQEQKWKHEGQQQQQQSIKKQQTIQGQSIINIKWEQKLQRNQKILDMNPYPIRVIEFNEKDILQQMRGNPNLIPAVLTNNFVVPFPMLDCCFQKQQY